VDIKEQIKNIQSNEIASAGQTSTHLPHSTHSCESTIAMPSSSSEMASTGQVSTHWPHPVHSSRFIIAAMILLLPLSLLKYCNQTYRFSDK
jgi:acid phosphatase family membrane protein YuiD